jgi:hypothetical protein
MAYEDGVFATFYDEAVHDKTASKEQGCPVFNDVLYIRIQVPNSVDCVPRPATDKDKTKYPLSWQAYQTGKEPPEQGLPIAEWPQLTASELKVCQANNIKTVEQLAEVADGNIHRLGLGGQGLKNRAKKFIEGLGEKDMMRSRIKELESKIAKLEKKAQAAPKKKRKVVRVAAQ